MLRIAIIGGGIGGLFAALSIHHHCSAKEIQIDIYEQAPEYEEIGAGVGIGPNAATLIKRLGLLDEVLKISGDRAKTWLSFRRYDTGAEIHTVKIPDEGSNTMQLSMHRAEFLEILVRAVRARGAATLHTHKRCVEVEDQGDEVSIKFADGTTTSGHLVIGADGIHSVIRAQYVQDAPRYGDMVIYRGLCDLDKIRDEWTLPTFATVFMAPNKHFLTFTMSNNTILNVFAFVSTPWEEISEGNAKATAKAKEGWTTSGAENVMQEEFKDFAPIVQSVIRNLTAQPLKWVLFDRQPTPEWIFAGGKVALLGDAAHAMCPHQGAGAGQGIEDGYILGRVLEEYLGALGTSQSRSLRDCLGLYHSIRFPRSKKVQVTSRQAGDLYEMKIDELVGLSYEDCLPVVKAKFENRMEWLWRDDIDEMYEKARAEWQARSS
ncbi:hypothetical protein N7466_000297 [Penicillium verhagenii]|uniref:uncharacterized protein n=1 Tax=Penicillium verhagenii TaxID=1562060 RepID=UPI0025456432|nr:uncharacterized protein N7466_000297 [Penicillium verhagenii]KAJ5947282.1 hypothetical protein N7466_000297 [Penicillium verhagenii]